MPAPTGRAAATEAPALDRLDTAAGGEAPLWRSQSDAVLGRLLERWLPSGQDSVLKTDLYDEAVSDGLYPVLSARARRVVGIDNSPAVAAAAVARHEQLVARVADVRAIPFRGGEFDAVLSNSTLDHLPDRPQVERALREIARVTRPGGRLLLTLDNPLNPLLALRNSIPVRASRRLRQGFPYEPGWTCGPRKLRDLLTDAGFEVAEQTAIVHAPRAIVARLRAEPGARRDASFGRILSLERLEHTPVRYLSGHFVAALAMRRESGDGGEPA